MYRNQIVGGGVILYHFGKNIRVLVVRSSKSNKWGFPKGHKEGFERDLRQTATRELEEETGIKIHASKLQGRGFKIGDYLYWNVKHDRLERVDIQKEELTEYSWMNIEDIVELKDEECNYGLKFFKNRQHDLKFKNFIEKHTKTTILTPVL